MPQDQIQPYWSLTPTEGLPSALNAMSRWYEKLPSTIALRNQSWTDDNTVMLPLRKRMRQFLSESEIDQLRNLLIENVYEGNEPLIGNKMSENLVLLDGLIKILPKVEEVVNYSVEEGSTVTGDAFRTMAKAEVYQFFTQSAIPIVQILRKKYADNDVVHTEIDNLSTLLTTWLQDFEKMTVVKLTETNLKFWFSNGKLVLAVKPKNMEGKETVIKRAREKNQGEIQVWALRNS